MPELHNKWAYPVVWLILAASVIAFYQEISKLADDFELIPTNFKGVLMILTARDAMTPGVKSVRSDATLPDLGRRFSDENVEGYAVVDDGILLGEVSRSDILRRVDLERSDAEMATGFWSDGSGIDSPLPAADWVSEIIGKHMDHLHVSDVMNRHCLSVSPNEPLIAVAEELVANNAKRVFVLEDHRVIGIITAYDFLRLYANRSIIDNQD